MRLIDITPQSLEKLKEDMLKDLWKKLSLIWESENLNKEAIIGRAIFIINEFQRRSLDIEKTKLYDYAQVWKIEHGAMAEGIIWRVNKTKIADVFNYDYALAIPSGMRIMSESIVDIKGEKYSNAGRSYDTAVKAQIGDIITIRFNSAELHQDRYTGEERIFISNPIFTGESEQKVPGSIEEIKKKAQTAGILTIKTNRAEIGKEIEEAVRAPFGSPGGKRYMADRLVRMFPEHKVYVEPFIGGGAVLWKKNPSEQEVINDFDADIAMAYKTIQDLTDSQWEELKKMDWKASKAGFAKAKAEIKDATGLKKFHDFIYLKQFSDVAQMSSYDDRDDAKSWWGINNLMRLKERLKGVTILNLDYSEVISKYDGPDTFFYIDPPYPSAKLSWKWMPQTESVEGTISKIRGKFLMSYELTKSFAKFNKWTIKLWAIAHPGQHHQGMFKKEQLISNYKIVKNTKYLNEACVESGYDWFSIFHEHFVANGYAKNWLKLKDENKITRIQEAFKDFDLEIKDGERKDEILQAIRDKGFSTFSKVFERIFEKSYADESKILKCVFQSSKDKSSHLIEQVRGETLVGWRVNHKIKESVGTVEFGAQKSFSNEYFFQSKSIDSKIVYRKTKIDFKKHFNNSLIKSVVANYLFEEDLDDRIERAIKNPETIMEEIDLIKTCEITEAERIIPRKDKGESGWLAINPIEQTPYVLTREAVINNWMPPLGYSALPKKIREEIPEVLQYWKSKNKIEAINKRNMLFEQQATTLQSILLSKERFKSKEEAIAWLKKNNKKFGKIDVTENTWRARQREPEDFKPGQFVTHKITDGIQFVLGKLKESLEESQHRHDQCMSCSAPPTIELLWAEGKGHAWFCASHFKSWSAEHKDDIDYVKEIKDGEASKQFSDNPNPNIKK